MRLLCPAVDFRKLTVAAMATPVFLSGLATSTPALAQEVAVEAPARPAATMEDMEWLVGTWAGTGIGGNPAGESFSRAGDGQLVGHFWQLDEQGDVRFYEIITVTRDGDSLAMRLKHFTADLTGWEGQEGAQALEFPLLARDETTWVFGPVSFTRPAPDMLEVSVRMQPGDDGAARSLDFSYTRVR